METKKTKKATKKRVSKVKEIVQKESDASIKTVVEPVVEVKEETSKEKKSLSFSTKELVLLIFAIALVALALGLLCGKLIYKGTGESSDFLTSIQENYEDIKANYTDVDDKTLLEGAISGMLNATGDPYASVIESNSSFMLEVDGEYNGLGIEISTKAIGDVTVSQVFANSGAEDAGIKVGDKVISVDDVTMANGTGSTFANYVLNSSNSSFTVKVERNGEELTFVVAKKKITIPSITSKTLEANGKKIAYIDASIFSGTTYEQFKKALAEADTSNGLILDLRGNTGGRLDVVVSMLSELLDSSNIIYQTDDNGDIQKFYSTGSKNFSDKIVILVDSNSASASEIMTAALKQDLGATVVGKTTYGKGTVQQLKTLSSGVQYKITTKKWLTPDGSSINGTGIKPDYDVDQSAEHLANATDENDTQLQKALSILSE